MPNMVYMRSPTVVLKSSSSLDRVTDAPLILIIILVCLAVVGMAVSIDDQPDIFDLNVIAVH